MTRVGELVSELGGDADALLRAHDIDPAATEDFNRYIRYDDAGAVLGHAARQLDCPDFGLRLGSKQELAALGPLGVILRNAETVGDAVAGVCRFLSRLAPADTAEMDHSSTSAKYVYSTILDNEFDRRQMVEKNQTLALHAFRVIIGPNFTPVRVTFQHERLAPLKSYLDVFGCTAQFGAEENSICLAPGYFTRTIRDRDAASLQLAEEYLTQLPSGLVLADQVRAVTRRLLLVEGASLREVSRAVSRHERALQRELASEGTSYQKILDDVRRTVAWELAATGVPVTQMSRALGYAEQSSFTRACHRWFGESPRALCGRRRGQLPEAQPEVARPSGGAAKRA